MGSHNHHSVGKLLTRSKVIFFVSLFVLIFFSINLTREIFNRRDLQKDIDKLQQEINGLESKNENLTGLIDYFNSLDFVEEEARTKLNLRKPGEKIIIVPEEEESINAENQDKSILTLKPAGSLKANPKKWWDYFFKNNF